jgi:hypothetical protein
MNDEREHAYADEREYIDYESPIRLDLLLEQIPPKRRWDSDGKSYCSVCGHNPQPRPTSELWVIKHRSPLRPLGELRTYCPDHLCNAPEWREGARPPGVAVGGTGRCVPSTTWPCQ